MEIKSFEYGDLIDVLPECILDAAWYAKPQSVQDLRQLVTSELLDAKDLNPSQRAELREFLERISPEPSLDVGTDRSASFSQECREVEIAEQRTEKNTMSNDILRV